MKPYVWLTGLLLLSVVASERQKLFYIYEFPGFVSDTWISRETRLTNKTVWKHAFNENEGFGHFYNGTEYFETWQYSSFRLILSRLLRSKYRTRDISKASLFFIPYDSGAECYLTRKGEFRLNGNPLAEYVNEQLSLLPTFTRHKGVDHFQVHSSSLAAHSVSVKMRSTFDSCINSTILTVEKLPRVHRWIRHYPFIQPIPMASMFHWRASADMDGIPGLQPQKRKRDIFISYFASASTSIPESNKLRVRLHTYCREANKATLTRKAAGVRDRFGKMCEHELFGSGTNRDAVDAFGIMNAYERSIYCLCPAGDTPIRRAIFDAILAGCIPVLFKNSGTPYPLHQYDWHMSDEVIRSITVTLDASTAPKVRHTNFIMDLATLYSASEVKQKQEAIAAVARTLQYSMPPDVRQFGFPTVKEPMSTWDPPFKDVVDIILDQMMVKIEKHIPESVEEEI